MLISWCKHDGFDQQITRSLFFLFLERNKRGDWWGGWTEFPHPSLINLSLTNILSSVKYRSHKIICYKLVLAINDVGSQLFYHCRTVLCLYWTGLLKKQSISFLLWSEGPCSEPTLFQSGGHIKCILTITEIHLKQHV